MILFIQFMNRLEYHKGDKLKDKIYLKDALDEMKQKLHEEKERVNFY